MHRIATKMLEIKKKDGSMLGLALTKYSGKFGVLNYAVEGMMSSLGYTSFCGHTMLAGRNRCAELRYGGYVV